MAARVANTEKFAVSQDQRNTARARLRFQAPRKVWFAIGGECGSGLLSEVGHQDRSVLLGQYGASVLDRVNIACGRVRPNFSLDMAAGAEIYRKEERSASFQIEAANVTDRINVINFASVFRHRYRIAA